MTNSEYIARLEAQNAALTQQVALLQEKVAALLLLLQQREVKKDSHNSHLPPSQDLPQRNKSLRPPSPRKSGGQPGHSGSTLKMSLNPDLVQDLKSDFCNVCGTSLAGEVFSLHAIRQVVDLPPLQPVYEEFRQFACRCPGCQHQQIAAFPLGVQAPIQYGPNIQALAAYFSVYQYVPYRRLKHLLAHVFQLPLSEGSIANLLTQAAAKAQFVYQQIKTEIALSPVVGSDETSVPVKGRKWWIWVWQNLRNTFIVASANRGSKTIDEVWPAGLTQATLVSDRWAAQLKVLAQGHQLCLAHLLRDVIFLAESEGHEFARGFKKFIQLIFARRQELQQRNQAYTTEEAAAQELEAQLNELLLLTIPPEQHPKTDIFQRAMLKYRNYLLPCLYDLGIPPDNNASERAIRNIKVKQKISGQFKTGQTAFCTLRSVVDTLIKRQLDVLTHLTQIMHIHPE